MPNFMDTGRLKKWICLYVIITKMGSSQSLETLMAFETVPNALFTKIVSEKRRVKVKTLKNENAFVWDGTNLWFIRYIHVMRCRLYNSLNLLMHDPKYICSVVISTNKCWSSHYDTYFFYTDRIDPECVIN